MSCTVCNTRAATATVNGKATCSHPVCLSAAATDTALEDAAIIEALKPMARHLARTYKTFDMEKLGRDGMLDCMRVFLAEYRKGMSK